MAKKKAEVEAAPETEQGETINKTEAVRRALADGVDTPLDGVVYVKQKFGVEITPQMFSSYKSLAKKKADNSVSNGRRPAKAAGSISSSGKANPADLARTIKALVEQHGAEAVVEMAKVFE